MKWNDIQTIQFDNGIYIVFEKGELYKKYDRIVRIGTHTSDGRLKARLKNHFITENKDDSIFRKNIGLALLSLADDPYAEIWRISIHQALMFFAKTRPQKSIDIIRKISSIK